MIKIQILDFNRESELVFTATFEMVRAINSTYDCGNYTLEVNRKVVFNGFVSNDHELIIKNICWRSGFDFNYYKHIGK